MNQCEITYGNQKIPFDLVRSNRKTLETRVETGWIGPGKSSKGPEDGKQSLRS